MTIFRPRQQHSRSLQRSKRIPSHQSQSSSRRVINRTSSHPLMGRSRMLLGSNWTRMTSTRTTTITLTLTSTLMTKGETKTTKGRTSLRRRTRSQPVQLKKKTRSTLPKTTQKTIRKASESMKTSYQHLNSMSLLPEI